MNPIQLPTAAENVRKEIKNMIPETTTSSDQLPEIKAKILEDGNKTYLGTLAEGGLLLKKISLLTKEMLIGDGWGWHLVHFSITTQLVNGLKQGFLIPLSKQITLTPGGVLKERFYVNITTEPLINSGATVIFIVPHQ